MTRPLRHTALSLAAALLLLARPAQATFHLNSISEVMSGFNGDPNVQYVEIRFDAAGENAVHDTRLTAFNADGSVSTVLALTLNDVPCGAANRRLLYATSVFATLTGVTPDFTIPAGIITPSGMVCWGAPSSIFVPPPTWDSTNPNNYIDCVAYGSYTGPTRTGSPSVGSSGTPSALPPGDGTRALTRIAGQSTALTGNNATDFALRPPGPCRNTTASGPLCTGPGQCGVLGESCGNGNLDAGEDCDDGNTVNGDGCQNDCTLTPTPAQVACRRTVVKAASKFAKAYTKALGGCDEALLKGTIAGPCPDSKAMDKIDTAESKKEAAIEGKCNSSTPADAGFGAACPGFEGMCTAATTTISAVAACVDCVLEKAGDQLEAHLYDRFIADGQASALSCQVKIGKAVNKFFQQKTKLLAKCEDKVLLNKLVGPCPDPDTLAKIGAEEAKKVKAICGACGGADKLCDGNADTAPADIGITTCPAVTLPNGGPSCGAITITTLQDLADCVDCVAEFKADCAMAVAAHAGAVPPECNPTPAPTATPTPTATPP